MGLGGDAVLGGAADQALAGTQCRPGLLYRYVDDLLFFS